MCNACKTGKHEIAGIIYNQLKHCQKTCFFFYLWCNDRSGIRPLFTAKMFLVTHLHPVDWTASIGHYWWRHIIIWPHDPKVFNKCACASSCRCVSCRCVSVASLLVRLLCGSKMSFINYMVYCSTSKRALMLWQISTVHPHSLTFQDFWTKELVPKCLDRALSQVYIGKAKDSLDLVE